MFTDISTYDKRISALKSIDDYDINTESKILGQNLKGIKNDALRTKEQLKVKEERFAEQTQLVRQQNRDIITLERKVADLEIELVKVRCNDEYCPFREPPTAKTPPRPGMSKEEYHLSKRKQLCQPQPQSK